MNELLDPCKPTKYKSIGPRSKRWLALLVVILFGLPLTAVADFTSGMNAYERQDYGSAYREFSSLAEAGDPDAQYMLGRLYERGNGVLQD